MMTSNVKLLSTNKVEETKKTNISNETLATLIKLTSNRDISSYEDWVSLLEREFNVIVPLDQLVEFFSLEREIEDTKLIYKHYLNYECTARKMVHIKDSRKLENYYGFPK